MTTPAPLISIIIPTRDRPDTLVHCLRGMRLHKTRDLEIVVVDTGSTGAARPVAEEAARLDDRVRYVAAPESKSQRHSFELGLAAARGDYLAIIGDDDGYVIGSIDWLADRLKRTPVDAVRWNMMLYIWPSLSVDGRGFFDIYLELCNGGSAVLPAAPLAAKSLTGKLQGSWANLLVYHGMIARRVYERMKAKTGGVFFAYPMADVFVHNLLPFNCETYLQVNDLVSIYGMSHWSANASWTGITSGEQAAESDRWISESLIDEVGRNQPWHPDQRTLRYHDFNVLRLGEAYGLLGGHSADQRLWTKLICKEIKQEPWKLGSWLTMEPKAPFDAEMIAEVRRKFGVRGFGEAEMSDYLNRMTGYLKSPSERLPSLRVAAIDPDLPDTVEGAMRAVEALLGSDPAKFEAAAEPERVPPLPARLVRRSLQAIREVAPGAVSRIMQSPVMPRFAWRMAHRLYSGRLPMGHAALERIAALAQANPSQTNASQAPQPARSDDIPQRGRS
jgi:hypothetical protein